MSIGLPSLKDEIEVATKKLDFSKEQFAECTQANIGWQKRGETLQNQQQSSCGAETGELQTRMKALEQQCSLSRQLDTLHEDKHRIDDWIDTVQLGRSGWVTESQEMRDRRVDELRRQSENVNTQILSLLRCGGK
jgi:hypothetical protein